VLQFALGGTALVVGLQGFSRSVAQFLVLRAVAGLFAGGVMPNAHAIIGRMSRRSRRGRAYGVAGSALAIGNFAGPMVGGIVAALLEVRAVFWVTACLLLLVGAGVWGVRRTGVNRRPE
jgi:DHA1 family multidrug resistance protein-like MFS transporter